MGDEQRVSWQELLAPSRDDGRRFIVRADEKLSAFVELERQVLTRDVYLASIDAECAAGLFVTVHCNEKRLIVPAR
jgi:hypothetical protein